MPPQNPPPAVFTFSVDASLAPWNVPPSAWLQQHNKTWDGLAVGTVVFDEQGRVLLVQRAAHDSMPNRWEIPGGAADQEEDGSEAATDDASSFNRRTILGAASRELWEESGLVARRYTHFVPQPEMTAGTSTATGAVVATGVRDDGSGGYVFTNRTGKRVFCRFVFHAAVHSCSPVVLDPEEHQDYVWATEEEVRQERLASGRAIPVTVKATQALILEAFRLRYVTKDGGETGR